LIATVSRMHSVGVRLQSNSAVDRVFGAARRAAGDGGHNRAWRETGAATDRATRDAADLPNFRAIQDAESSVREGGR